MAKAGVLVVGARCGGAAPTAQRRAAPGGRPLQAPSLAWALPLTRARAGGGLALWAVKSLLSTAFTLVVRAPAASARPHARCARPRYPPARCGRLTPRRVRRAPPQVLVLLAFVAWTITQSSSGGGGGGGAGGAGDDDDESDPLVAARKIMDKYK